MSIIEDGTGSGRKAGINNENRLLTATVSQDAILHLTSLGRTFSATTGIMNLTSASASIAGVVLNNSGQEIIFHSAEIQMNKSKVSGGGINTDQDVKLETVFAWSAHDLVTPLYMLPSKSSNAIDSSGVTGFQGAEGKTVTGGAAFGANIVMAGSGPFQVVESVPFFLKDGDVIAMKLTPPANNTDLDVTVTVTLSFNDGSI